MISIENMPRAVNLQRYCLDKDLKETKDKKQEGQPRTPEDTACQKMTRPEDTAGQKMTQTVVDDAASPDGQAPCKNAINVEDSVAPAVEKGHQTHTLEPDPAEQYSDGQMPLVYRSSSDLPS